MPTYDEWNNALIDYLTVGIPHGSTIFLDINEEILDDVGRVFKTSDNDDRVGDFKQAVRAQVIIGQRIRLDNIPIYRSEDTENTATPNIISRVGDFLRNSTAMKEQSA